VRRAESVHDFRAKLSQPSMWPAVRAYVEWQRQVLAACACGDPAPLPPQQAPLSINLDLTTACNYACDHCIDWDILNSRVRHADDELRESMRTMAARGLKSVILIGGGEPTLYPGFASFVELLKSLDLQVAVVSNGSRNDRILQAAPFLDERDWVRLSLDSGSNDVFRRMHKPAKATLDLDEICGWIPKIKAANPRFKLGFSFVITWQGAERHDDVKVVENIHEIVMATKRAREAGFDYISFKPFLERSATGSEVLEPERVIEDHAAVLRRIQASIDEAKALERPGFRVMESTNLRVLMQGSWRDYTQQPRTCHMQALRQVVTPLGVYNCPAYRGVPQARIADKEAYRDGTAADATARDTAAILRRFDASRECSQVTCLYNSANWWLEELIESDADLARMPLADERADHFL
jgi:sulfatase maturation enzyme AslB (radical SAM superfamily)